MPFCLGVAVCPPVLARVAKRQQQQNHEPDTKEKKFPLFEITHIFCFWQLFHSDISMTFPNSCPG